MSSRSTARVGSPAPVRSLLFAALFVAAAVVGRMTALDGTGLSLVWPAAGVAAAWFCVQGTATRWLDVGLLLAATAVVNALTGAGPVLCTGFALANLAQTLLFAHLRHRWWTPGTALGSRQLAMLLAAALISAAGGALVGVVAVVIERGALGAAVTAVWVTRNAVAILLVTPVLLRLSARVEVVLPGGRGAAELVLALTATAAAYGGVFWGVEGLSLAFVPLATTIWLAVRFDTTVVVVTGLLAAAVTVLGTLAGHGPFAAISEATTRALVVQVHVGFIAVLGLALAVGRDERESLLARLRTAKAEADAARAEAERRERFNDAVLSSVGTGIVVADPDGRLVRFNDTARQWHGIDADAGLDRGEHPGTYALFAADGVTPLTAHEVPLHRTLREGHVSGLEVVIAPPGLPEVPVVCSGRTVTDAAGAVLGAVVAMHDLRDVRAREADLAEVNSRLTAHATQVERLAAASRAVLTADDPRLAVCVAAVEVSGAHAAFLLQPDEDGRLVSTSTTGLPADVVLRVDPERETSLVRDSYVHARPRFVADVAAHPEANRVLLEQCRTASAAWQPVVAPDGRVIGVLGVVWRERVEALDPTTAAVLDGLAAEAAHAVHRADLLSQLSEAAEHDALTGLVNRRRWDDLARAEITRATRSGEPLTFALLDLDHFKRYNDTRGHLAGDQLLRDFAAAAGAQLRELDTLARWGGEEFALLLPGCTAADAVEVVNRVRAAVPDSQTCTVGLCQWWPGSSAQDVLAAADRALYRGKRTRDSTVVEPFADTRGGVTTLPR